MVYKSRVGVIHGHSVKLKQLAVTDDIHFQPLTQRQQLGDTSLMPIVCTVCRILSIVL